MNTFIIYQGDSTLLNIVCENPPSLNNRLIILEVLERLDFQKVDYTIDIISDGKYHQVHDHDEYVDNFLKSFFNLFDGSPFHYGVRLYLK